MNLASIRLVLLLVGGLAILSAAGCGGDSDAEEPLTKAAFVKEATNLCRETRARNIARTEDFFAGAQQREESVQDASVAGVRSLLVPSLRVQTEEVRALGAPQGDEKEVEAILDEVERVLDEANADPARYLQEVGEYKRPFQEAHQMAKAYGIQACAWA